MDVAKFKNNESENNKKENVIAMGLNILLIRCIQYKQLRLTCLVWNKASVLSLFRLSSTFIHYMQTAVRGT